jgi:hypothetical protein
LTPGLHPKLACLWALVTIAVVILSWMLRRDWRSLFTIYVWLCAAQNLGEWWGVYHVSVWWWVYRGWWALQFFGYGLTLILAIWYAVECAGRKANLPQNFVLDASLVLSCLVLMFVFMRWAEAPLPDQSWVLDTDHDCRLWLAGTTWVAVMCCHWFVCASRKLNILRGFVGIYTAGIVTSGMLVHWPVAREISWCIDLCLQLAVTAFWIWTMRATNAVAASKSTA